jgi:hypothetical protein
MFRLLPRRSLLPPANFLTTDSSLLPPANFLTTDSSLRPLPQLTLPYRTSSIMGNGAKAQQKRDRKGKDDKKGPTSQLKTVGLPPYTVLPRPVY